MLQTHFIHRIVQYASLQPELFYETYGETYQQRDLFEIEKFLLISLLILPVGEQHPVFQFCTLFVIKLKCY